MKAKHSRELAHKGTYCKFKKLQTIVTPETD